MKNLIRLGLLAAATVVAFGLALKLGSVEISWSQVWQTLSDPHSRASDAGQIVWALRLPRALLALLVGAALALSGTTFQALLRNPLADPYIVGTSAGAALGATLSVALTVAGWPVDRTMFAFLGAVATMIGVYRLAWVDGRLPVETFLLAGVVVGSIVWALATFLLLVAREQLQQALFWLMGDLSNASLAGIAVVLPHLLIGTVVLLLLAHPLNLITLGEETAFQLGVPVEGFKLLMVTVASLLTAAAVSVSGLIGFVGLVVPHASRRLVGADHRVLLPGAALAGGTFLLLADTASRVLLPGVELPVGVVTALLGGPFFLFVLVRRRRAGNR
ncbi:MAG TPA: iron ABC transporter permease [Candidatus Xenobia bacterium]|jgi:iron complex transport system permease protein